MNKNEKNTSNELKITKIAISEDLFKKIKALGILVDDNKNEAILLGNAINKLYEMSKENISKEFL